MPRTSKKSYIIFCTRSHKYFCVGLRDIRRRGWKERAADATLFSSRSEAYASIRAIQVYGRGNKSSFIVTAAPQCAINAAENAAHAASLAEAAA